MQKGSSGIGMRKHGVSGNSGKSPKFRQHLKREAEKDRKRAPKPLPFHTMSELIDTQETQKKSRRKS